MKITGVKTYQSVQLDGKTLTWITDNPKYGGPVSMEQLPHGILFKTKQNNIVVPFTNIAYYTADQESEMVSKPKATKQA